MSLTPVSVHEGSVAVDLKSKHGKQNMHKHDSIQLARPSGCTGLCRSFARAASPSTSLLSYCEVRLVWAELFYMYSLGQSSSLKRVLEEGFYRVRVGSSCAHHGHVVKMATREVLRDISNEISEIFWARWL